MEVLGIGTVAAATGAANVYGYNREAWATNLQVNQNRRHQKQSVLLSQSNLFRDDVREMVSAAVTRQSNYVTCATLILGMASTSFTSSILPAEATEYARTAFLCCTGASLFYLVLSVVATLVATYLAVSCRRDFLTSVVRLPIEDLVEENAEIEPEENMQHFEHQSLRKIFRLPGLNHRRGDRHGEATSTGTLTASLDVDLDSAQVAEEAAKVSVWRDRMDQRRRMYLRAFSVKEHEWTIMGVYAVFFGWLGVSHLLQAHAYHSVALVFTSKNKLEEWSALIVQVLMTLADATIIIGLSEFLKHGFWRIVLEVALTCGGQVCIFFTIRCTDRSWVARVCVPLMFLCHGLVNLGSTTKLRQLIGNRAAKTTTSLVALLRTPKTRTFYTENTGLSDGDDSDEGSIASSRVMRTPLSKSLSFRRSSESLESEHSPSTMLSAPVEVTSEGDLFMEEPPAVFLGGRIVSAIFILCTIWASLNSFCATTGLQSFHACGALYKPREHAETYDTRWVNASVASATATTTPSATGWTWTVAPPSIPPVASLPPLATMAPWIPPSVPPAAAPVLYPSRLASTTGVGWASLAPTLPPVSSLPPTPIPLAIPPGFAPGDLDIERRLVGRGSLGPDRRAAMLAEARRRNDELEAEVRRLEADLQEARRGRGEELLSEALRELIERRRAPGPTGSLAAPK
mmetsp:Transcript_15539/g.31511  ORF Transcript_15539/g.31511 Transcript_15539/m.31511 type:complete len:686 (-) Transcript_15539:133-2190(-)